ncbi:MAG: xanthine dehydrogenase family protein molybdopterin-binding subunit [Chloroflexota bacterium]|nr:xanthine dehydrogenase family protein molybdopterin-binding subunit [Chloroflexota bacterium]
MAEPEYAVLGKNVPRPGGVERVTGAGIYGVDLVLRDALCGGVLRSAHAHARIISIDTSEAEALQGVHAVITAADAPDVKYVYGKATADRHILARDKVRYLGDPVAAVAAETRRIVKQALKAIKVAYEPLPVLTDAEEAIKPTAPAIHNETPPPNNLPSGAEVHNVCAYSAVHIGDPDQAMAAADLVVEETYETKVIHPQYLEPRIAAARPEADGRLTIWANTQAPFNVRADVARVLNLPLTKVRALATDIGGAFGGKGLGITTAAGLEAICALLAMKAGRPVMFVLDKGEETVSTTVRGGTKTWIQTGVKRDGTILARKARLIFDAGAYSGFGPLAGSVATRMLAGWYRTPNVHVDGYAVYTNKQVCGPVRGPGGPQSTFAVESHMDSIAAKLQMDPLAFRLKNAPAAGESIAGVPKLRDVSLTETMRLAAEKIGWGKATLGKNQGIGFATGFWLEGSGPRDVVVPGGAAIIKINEDGSATVNIGKVDFGTAARLGIPLIVAEELGLAVEDVTVLNVDTDTSPWDGGTVGSRSLLVSGNAARLAAIDARKQLFGIAARQLEASTEDLEVRNREIRVKGTPARSVPLAAVAAAAHLEMGGVIGKGGFDSKAAGEEERAKGNSPPFATHAAIVEVDPAMGKIEILKYVAVHDVGFIIHPQAVEGQIEGAAAMGLGQALCEQVIVDAQGRTVNPTFVDYLMPTVNFLPRIEPFFIHGYAGEGPYGAKGAGEIACYPPLPCIANAVYDATGVRIRTLPLSPENVLRAMREPLTSRAT